ncbi:biotin synthase BioB [Segnochrobactrum spirostomi]|uniref:Biotin synthase n=1 Tax=Segnochrobactrum spirostomi TaxID=2608987 RepID=A0A6A7Y9A5_9HYPH|nr:biotin synthase BioB [Segnochrobactrum spirostomi]MQT14561.1 biotin synthase BioB [Segnochrobactrum spirostomi]
MSVSHPAGRDADDDIRTDWSRDEIQAIHDLPLPDLLYRAQTVHRRFFNPAQIEAASLLSIKTGGCPEDCGYCSQSARYDTGIKASKLMEIEAVVTAARAARDAGASRFCMGAAWRSPKDRDIDKVCTMIERVRDLGLETCVTLGMLTDPQADRLKQAGLDYYSHNVDTSPEHYGRIITTRTLEDRLETIERVRAAGIKLCCGGIVGMGEQPSDRLGLLHLLAGLDPHPESVPINQWSVVSGVPVAETAEPPDPIAFVRLIAVARILMPRSIVRLSAGRTGMSEELQALCFLAGANSLFLGSVLLTTRNPDHDRDFAMLRKLGLDLVPAVAPGATTESGLRDAAA